MNMDLLKRLCTVGGCSGDEGAVRELLLKEAAPWADRVECMPSGNLILYKKGKKRPVSPLMLTAHMDEVGLIITHIRPDGLLCFSCVGGIDRRVLCGKHVVLEGKFGGVIAVKPVHLTGQDKRGEVPPVQEMVIDIGADSREEAQKVISPGSYACFEGRFWQSGEMIFAKALDDRAGCAILAEMLRQELPYDMTFAFTVQEEVGLRGAQTAAFKVDPRCALVVETTTAADIPDVPSAESVCRLGGGPAVPFMDSASIYDRAYYRLAMETAKELGIPCQTKHAIAGGNDSGVIQKSRGGVRTCAVSLPCRYLHSPVVAAHQFDLEAMEMLIPALAAKMAGGN
jgi:putative aminopeptidase FrvX